MSRAALVTGGGQNIGRAIAVALAHVLGECLLGHLDGLAAVVGCVAEIDESPQEGLGRSMFTAEGDRTANQRGSLMLSSRIGEGGDRPPG